MNQRIDPTNYEKLQDDIYYIGGGIYLRLNVVLAKKDKDGNRRFFVSNYRYSSKYVDKGKVITMRRSFDYYLTIECTSDNTQNIIIRVQNMILLKAKIKEVTKWFSDSNVFGIRNNKLVISKKVSVMIDGFPMEKFITLEPVIINYDDSSVQIPGVRFMVNNMIFTDMAIENFYGLAYLIDTLNLYQSAQILTSSIGVIENPRTMEFNDEEEIVEEPNVNGTDGRKPRKLNRSYFDKD